MSKGLEMGKAWCTYTPQVAEFMAKVIERSGVNPEGTYSPNAINPGCALDPSGPVTDIPAAMKEAEMVMCGAVGDVLEKTGTRPEDVDILVTMCSIFCPTPSLASMIVNKFKLRQDVQAYHLGGMGCGNGVIAIGLVRDLLQAHPNATVVFVPCEITTYAYYTGFHARYCVANCIFRMGAAAAVLSNKRSDARRAKYRLLYAERRHTGQNDEAYGAVRWGPDPDGVNGLYLSRAIVNHAGDALEGCLKAVTPKILTWSQLGQGAANMLARSVYPKLGWQKPKSYQPDFTQCVQHFAIHAGGYAVLKGIQAGMKLPPREMIPSFAALRDYGNTSSSTTWYIMGYIESCRGVKKGDVSLQIGMGSGMKAGVAVWKALRDISDVHSAWRHLAGNPLTEADLPRAIEEDDLLKPKPKPTNPAGGGKFADADAGAAAAGPSAAGKRGNGAAAPSPPPATRTSARRTRAAA